jgi:hypothetical protein
MSDGVGFFGCREDPVLMDRAVQFVRDALGSHPATDGQIKAMAMMANRIGFREFRATSVLARHKERNPVATANAFLLWPGRDPGHADAERAAYIAGTPE